MKNLHIWSDFEHGARLKGQARPDAYAVQLIAAFRRGCIIHTGLAARSCIIEPHPEGHKICCLLKSNPLHTVPNLKKDQIWCNCNLSKKNYMTVERSILSTPGGRSRVSHPQEADISPTCSIGLVGL
jgi:hypothetical protein